MNGNPPRKFGAYEARQVTSGRTLCWALVAALVGVGINYLVPYLEGSGETAAAIGAVLAVVLRIISEWLRDNSEKSHGRRKEIEGASDGPKRDSEQL